MVDGMWTPTRACLRHGASWASLLLLRILLVPLHWSTLTFQPSLATVRFVPGALATGSTSGRSPSRWREPRSKLSNHSSNLLSTCISSDRRANSTATKWSTLFGGSFTEVYKPKRDGRQRWQQRSAKTQEDRLPEEGQQPSEVLERGVLLPPGPVHSRKLWEAYQKVQRDYREKAFGANRPWKLLASNREGIEVSTLEHPSDPLCPYVRMTAIMPVSVQECWDFLRIEAWDRTMPLMDPFYEGVSIHGQYQIKDSHHKPPRGHAGGASPIVMTMCRKRTKRMLAFDKRDFVFVSVQDHPLPDGTWVSGSVSVQTDQIPRQPGYVRAFQDSIAFYTPILNNTQTRISIICRIDLNDHGSGNVMGRERHAQDRECTEDNTIQTPRGHIPMWLYVKIIGPTGLQSIQRMRHALIQDRSVSKMQK